VDRSAETLAALTRGEDEMIEDELKLSVPGEFDLPELAGRYDGIGEVQPAGTRTLRATYWDTADLRLARNGLTLRYRTGEGGAPWQLKLPVADAGPGVREELAEPGKADEVPAPLRALVTGWVRTAVLAPVATLRTNRAVYRVLDVAGGELAELVDDTVSVLDGRRVVARFRELEVERRAAGDPTMGWLRDELVAAGAVEGEFTPKVVRALGPAATERTDLPAPPPLTGRPTGRAVVGAALAHAVRRLVEHDALVRRGAPDAVHQMRVACRRLRSDLRTFRPLVDPEWAAGLREELSWLGEVLGAARDLEVQQERIRAAVDADPLAPVDAAAAARIDAALSGREEAAVAGVLSAMDTPRYRELLERVVEAARHPAFSLLAAAPADESIVPLIGGAWKKLLRKGDKLSADKPDDAWHRVRILAKRARYAAEAAAPAAGKPARRLAAAAESVQDLLGNHQDAAVAAQTLRDLATEHPDDPQFVLTCGRLAERERADLRAIRSEFPQVWQEATGGKAARWLER
jgi:CHAD domain-containing protein